MVCVYLGVGSNIHREKHIKAGLTMLAAEFGELVVSPIYESEAVGFDGDPFLNLVVGLETDLSVGQLNQHIPLSQSALSQHLAALRQAQLVNTRRDGQTVFYRIQGEAPLAIIAVLKNRFCPEDAS